MTHCVFCQAAAHEIPAVFVLEDRLTIAIVDLRQPHDGHVLVLPRAHVASFDNLDKETAAELAWSTVRVTRAVSRAYQPEGQSLWQSNGAHAGQEVFHVHVHVLPRVAGDGLGAHLSGVTEDLRADGRGARQDRRAHPPGDRLKVFAGGA
jgi:histidine triad (HIT) family protein